MSNQSIHTWIQFHSGVEGSNPENESHHAVLLFIDLNFYVILHVFDG